VVCEILNIISLGFWGFGEQYVTERSTFKKVTIAGVPRSFKFLSLKPLFLVISRRKPSFCCRRSLPASHHGPKLAREAAQVRPAVDSTRALKALDVGTRKSHLGLNYLVVAIGVAGGRG